MCFWCWVSWARGVVGGAGGQYPRPVHFLTSHAKVTHVLFSFAERARPISLVLRPDSFPVNMNERFCVLSFFCCAFEAQKAVRLRFDGLVDKHAWLDIYCVFGKESGTFLRLLLTSILFPNARLLCLVLVLQIRRVGGRGGGGGTSSSGHQ